MVRWTVSAKERDHVYFPNQGGQADKVYGAIAQAAGQRGNLLSVFSTTVKGGLFGKGRPSIQVNGMGFSATVSSMAVGPDLYVGYVVHQGKGQLNDLQIQDLEAFSEYLAKTLESAFAALSLTSE
jgi:hypothetical protein